MKQLTILALGWVLSAPTFAQPQLPQVVIKDVTWVSNNTVRVGNAINALYRITTQSSGTTDGWLNVDCATGQKTQLFASMYTSGPNRPSVRVYGAGSLNRYAPGIPFEPEADSPYSTNPALNVCQQNVPVPKWVALAEPDAQGDQLFIDVNNSAREGDRLQVRIATDYAHIHQDEKYLAPYSVKIADKVFDCAQNKSQTLNQFALDNQRRITDSQSEENSAFVALSAEEATLAKRLCAINDISQFSGKGTLEWREKPMAENLPLRPDFAQNDPAPIQSHPLPQAVAETVKQAVATPQQRPTFKRLSYTQKSPGEDLASFVVQMDSLPDGTLLTLDKMTLGGVVFYSQHVRLFNIVDVKKWDSLAEKSVISNTLENAFVLPPAAGAEYHWKNTQSDNKSTGKLCHADNAWRSATAISPHFSGRYLEFICTDDRGDGRPMSSDYAYLEDLRVFIRIGYHEAGEKKRFAFEDVTIVN
ncbi:MAG: surface-adhesin E family protein [Symbiopectobacterium sp.]|uniref:surface-adhesin E family protein n=1 Tax=Symbiopectobacterium sp. TaxID=2952789 RepID=UPI0039E775FF